MCVCVCVCVYIQTYINTYIDIDMYIHTCTYMYIHIHIHMFVVPTHTPSKHQQTGATQLQPQRSQAGAHQHAGVSIQNALYHLPLPRAPLRARCRVHAAPAAPPPCSSRWREHARGARALSRAFRSRVRRWSSAANGHGHGHCRVPQRIATGAGAAATQRVQLGTRARPARPERDWRTGTPAPTRTRVAQNGQCLQFFRVRARRMPRGAPHTSAGAGPRRSRATRHAQTAHTCPGETPRGPPAAAQRGPRPLHLPPRPPHRRRAC